MSLLPFLVIALGAGSASLLTRHRPDVAGGIGIAGLALAALAAAIAPATQGVLSPAAPLADEVSLLLLVGSVSALLLVLAGAGAGGVPRSLPGATLVTLGLSGLALTAGTPVAAIVWATAAAATSIVPLLDTGAVTERGAVATGVVLRAAVVAGVASLLAPVVAAHAAHPGAGIALLVVSAAAAVRTGVIPLHRANARLAGLAPPVAAPLALVWAPAIFALALLTSGAIPGAAGGSIGVERGLVVVVALGGMALATVAAILHDDLEHAVVYSVAADAALLLLAFASVGDASGAVWAWTLVMVIGRTALFGWAVAVGAPGGGRRLADIEGWARRSPLLAVALVAIAAGSIGWPGSAVLAARYALVDGVVDPPLVVPAIALSLATVLVYLRLGLAGVRRATPGLTVGAVPGASPARVRVATIATLGLAALTLLVGGGLLGARGG